MSLFTAWATADHAVVWCVSLLLQVTLMTAITAALATCFRWNAAIRYWVCCSGLLLILLCPLSVLCLQYAGIGLLSLPIAGATDRGLTANFTLGAATKPTSKESQAQKRESATAGPAGWTSPNTPLASSDYQSVDPHTHVDNAQPIAASDASASAGQLNVGASAAGSVELGGAGTSQSAGAATRFTSMLQMVVIPLLAAWLTGAALGLVRLIVAWRRLVRILDSATLVADVELKAAFLRACRALGMEPQRIQLKLSHLIAVPIAAGCVKPVVVLPARLPEQVTPRQLQEILVHEAAHIVRRDQILVLLQSLAGALYWFHPLVAWLNRQLAQAREEVCDNYVLAASDALNYSRTLLAVAELAGGARPLPGTVGLFTSRWKLEQRVAGLLDRRRNRMTKLTLLGCCLTGMSTAVVGLSSLATLKPAAAQTTGAPQAATAQKAGADTATKNDARQAAAAQETAKPFELRIVGPDEIPVPFTTIEIRPKVDPSWILQGTLERDAKYGTMVKATKDGRLTLRLPTKANPSFSVQMDGFGPYWAEWRNEPRPPAFTIQLEAARPIGGLVVDENGDPILGAVIHPGVYFKKRAGDASDLGVGTRIISDEAGRWQYKQLPKSMPSLGVEITHPQFMATRASLSPELFDLESSHKASAKIIMKKGVTLTGKVTDTEGKPVEDALIRTKFFNDIREARTNAAGDYALSGCEPSVARIVVSAKGLATDMQTVRISEEQMEPVDFVMQPGGHVRIRVIDENNKPIPKARIFFQKWREDHYDYFEFGHVNQYADEHGIWEWNEAPLDAFKADICRPDGMQLGRQSLQARAEEYVFSPPPALVIIGRVIDAETKQPLEQFQVVPGVRSSPEHMNWVPHETFKGRNGVFEYRETHDYFAHLFKVQAKDYLPAESRDIKSTEGRVELTFELKRGKGIDLLVIAPNGRPAVGAKVALGIPGAQINVDNGDIADGSTYAERTVADKEGRFRFPAQSTPYQLVITHEAGFAHIKSEELENAERVELTPWAKAEGVFRVAGKPVPGVKLYIASGNVHSYGPDVPNIFTSSYVVTGNDGQFALARVFPGHGSVQRAILKMVGEGAKEVTSSAPMTLEFYSGETTQVDFPGTGSRVVGQLEAPKNRDEKVIWAFADVEVRTNIALPPLPPPPVPVGEPADPAKKAEWHRMWQTSPEVIAWLELQELHRLAQRSVQHYSATVDPTGRFAIDDVSPGDYTLSVRFWEKQGMGRIDRLEFEVTEADATSRREVDLGSLELE